MQFLFKTCKSILNFEKKNAQITLGFFGHMQEKNIFLLFLYCF
jgi:hypothetical protein